MLELLGVEVKMGKVTRVSINFKNVVGDGYPKDSIWLDITEKTIHFSKTIRDGGQSLGVIDENWDWKPT